jgi:hypothetical protein
MNPPYVTPHHLGSEVHERPARDAVAHRGRSLLADARDDHTSRDLLYTLLLRLYPYGTDS